MNARVKPSTLLEPFKWTTPAADKASTFNQLDAICAARDVASGVAVVLALLEREDIDDGCEIDGEPIAPMFSSVDRGSLQRLAITSLRILSSSMTLAIDRANDYAEKRAGK